MDNRIFNVNGPLDHGDRLLANTLELAFAIADRKATAWRRSPTHGLILDWSLGAKGSVPFPMPMTAREVTPIVAAWLRSDEAKETKANDWDANPGDHDVFCTDGWRVYCEDWGHVLDALGFIAIKPVSLWHGK